MIEYVVEHNPDDRVLTRASRIIHSGGLVCFPTETNWVAVCNPFDKSAVEKLYLLRHVENSKHLTILSSDFSKAMDIAYISDNAFSLMKKVVPGFYTFIFEAKKSITKYLKASKIDHQVGIRFPSQHFVKLILKESGGNLLSTPLSHDLIPESDPEYPLYSALIEESLGHKLDLIIDPGLETFPGLTTIIDFTTDVPIVQRLGIGEADLFL